MAIQARLAAILTLTLRCLGDPMRSTCWVLTLQFSIYTNLHVTNCWIGANDAPTTGLHATA